MIEPRSSLQILRPETQGSQTLPEEQAEAEAAAASPIIEHDEPDNPIHPELEYEILHAGEDNSIADFVPLAGPVNPARQRTVKNHLKLLVSFVCLVIFGCVRTWQESSSSNSFHDTS